MERLILSHINAHLARNNILSTHQHGFREKLSCTTQLISSIHDWATSPNNRSQTDVLFLDFSKASDKVSHRKLIIKLKYYGITGHTLGWLNGFLSNRTQILYVNGSHSNSTNVTFGFPQGSVLGATLFLLYINDNCGQPPVRCSTVCRRFDNL